MYTALHYRCYGFRSRCNDPEFRKKFVRVSESGGDVCATSCSFLGATHMHMHMPCTYMHMHMHMLMHMCMHMCMSCTCVYNGPFAQCM